MDSAPAYIARPQQTGSCRLVTFFCWVIIVGVVAFLLRINALGTETRADQAKTATTAVPNIGLELMGRMALFQAAHLSLSKSNADPAKRDELLKSAAAAAVGPGDQLDLVILTREIDGPEAADRLLKKVSAHLPPGDLRGDAATLAALYGNQSNAVSPEDRARLEAQLGWFGKLASSQDLSPQSPPRRAVIASANRCFAVVVIGMVLGAGALLLGLALLVLLIVLFGVGKLKPRYQVVHAPANGRPVFLETFTLWMVCFLCVSWVFAKLHFANLLAHELLAVVMTAGVAMWPLLRGVTWPQLRQALGWHRGKGILLEMLIGACGYVAGLPIVAFALYITSLLMRLSHTQASHPIIEEFTTGMSTEKIVTLLLAAAVGAPLLEETIFRGALYSHLRRRWAPWISAGVVALVFAAMHPQGWAAIPVLGSIALVLAALREWRGSLIASMTAHAINNGALVLFLGLALK